MGIRESLLNTITSVGSSDFVRIVTSAGASSKATVQNLFKSFETGLGAKSSLTTSDYIRVVGSDDVLYKQSVSDVADKVLTLGKSASTTGTVSDLDALVPFTTGYATFDASVSPTGASGAFWYSVIGWGSNTRTEITCVDVSGTVYTKAKDYSGWKAWVKQPTRAEVDALNSKTTPVQITVTPNSTVLSEVNVYAYYSNGVLSFNGYFKTNGSVISSGTTLFTFNGIQFKGRPYVFLTGYDLANKGKVEVNPPYNVLNASGQIAAYNSYIYINASFAADYSA